MAFQKWKENKKGLLGKGMGKRWVEWNELSGFVDMVFCVATYYTPLASLEFFGKF